MPWQSPQHFSCVGKLSFETPQTFCQLPYPFAAKESSIKQRVLYILAKRGPQLHKLSLLSSMYSTLDQGIVPPNLSSIIANMETMLSKVNSRCKELKVITKVFPLIQLGSQTLYKACSGILMTALRKSTAARLTKRILGKLRRFLKRAKIAMKDPLPIVETRDKLASREVMRILLAKVREAILLILMYGR